MGQASDNLFVPCTTKRLSALTSEIRDGPDHTLEFEDISLLSIEPASDPNNFDDYFNTVDNIAALGLSFEYGNSHIIGLKSNSLPSERKQSVNTTPSRSKSFINFKKWTQSFYKASKKATRMLDSVDNWMELEEQDGATLTSAKLRGDCSQDTPLSATSSTSSFGFIKTVKSASISLTSFSITAQSKVTGLSTRKLRTERGSTDSTARNNISEDSLSGFKVPTGDPTVTRRLLQRRRILEEITTTEESYLADIRFLRNVSR